MLRLVWQVNEVLVVVNFAKVEMGGESRFMLDIPVVFYSIQSIM
jgi:hypothetical protein